MNFFQQQDHARRQTRTLVILFVLAVVAIVLAVNGAMMLIAIYMQGQPFSGHHTYPRGFFVANTLITLGLIAGGTMIELFNLRDGGDAVARMAGGRLVSPDTRDAQEKRLLNVVEEMSLASGIACPKVYVLDREESINAFAAGYQANEAVIAATRGTLNRLTRDELQGVVAHEFSHILNGDMRLNVRLIGVLFGIQMIAGFGQQLMSFGGNTHSDRDSKGLSSQSAFWVVGAALFAIGYIGIFFGRLIKSAVSRQREFLADASAVQFTRNPDGIGYALRKIGGLTRSGGSASRIQNGNAEQLSHLFLSAAKPNLLSGLFATHPPIRERLRRIYGRDIGMLDGPEIVVEELAEKDRPDNGLPDIPYFAPGFVSGAAHMQAAAEAIVATAASAYGNTRDTSSPLQKIRLAPEIDQAMHEPNGASAIVYALLLEGGQQQQLQSLREHAPSHVVRAERLAQAIHQLPNNARLPLLDLSMPALRQLSVGDRALLLANVDRLIAADQRVTLYEFVLQTVLTRRLDARAGRATPFRFSALTELKVECAILFSLAAHVAAPLLRQPAAALFMRGARAYPQLGFAEQDLLAVQSLGFTKVKLALDRANLLAPLATPMLIKSLVAIVDADRSMPLEMADLLRAICAAIDAPMPAAVAAIYTASGWPEAA
jgi:Zn-dependent protease with chaperone function